MKSLKQKITAIIVLIISFTVQAQELNLDAKSSYLSWTGKAAFTNYSLTGSLNTESGAITIRDGVIESLSVVINMKSLDHENKDLKRHLRSDDFFGVKTFTKATFELLQPIRLINGETLLVGNMTIKNKTHKEMIVVKLQTKETGLKITFNTALNRLDYGVTFNSPSIFKKIKEDAIADEFKLEGSLIFEK